MSHVEWPLIVFVVSAAIASVTDLRSRTIPNWVSYSALGCGLGGHLLRGGPLGLGSALLAALVCSLPMCLLFARGALGGGDVKLFAAAGALLGTQAGLALQLYAFCIVCGYALWCTTWHGQLLLMVRASYRASLHLLSPSRFSRPDEELTQLRLPMAPAMLLSSLLVLGGAP